MSARQYYTEAIEICKRLFRHFSIFVSKYIKDNDSSGDTGYHRSGKKPMRCPIASQTRDGRIRRHTDHEPRPIGRGSCKETQSHGIQVIRQALRASHRRRQRIGPLHQTDPQRAFQVRHRHHQAHLRGLDAHVACEMERRASGELDNAHTAIRLHPRKERHRFRDDHRRDGHPLHRFRRRLLHRLERFRLHPTRQQTARKRPHGGRHGRKEDADALPAGMRRLHDARAARRSETRESGRGRRRHLSRGG